MDLSWTGLKDAEALLSVRVFLEETGICVIGRVTCGVGNVVLSCPGEKGWTGDFARSLSLELEHPFFSCPSVSKLQSPSDAGLVVYSTSPTCPVTLH